MRYPHKIGTVDRMGVFIEVKYPSESSKPDKPALSICADIRRSGHCVGGGQSLDIVQRVATHGAPSKAWPASRIRKLLAIWERWHLNDMQPGCEHQRAWGWNTLPIDPGQPTDRYIRLLDHGGYTGWNMLTWITRAEHPFGLLSHPCPICGYKYGSAWLYEPLPQDVIDFIRPLVNGRGA